MSRPSLFMTLLIPGLAFAQPFRTVEPIGLDLIQQREVARAQADVVVGLKTIDAPNGVRCGGEAFEPRVVTTLDRECEVRLSTGVIRSLWVSFEADCLVITLRPPSEGAPRQLGEFTQRSATINGLETRTNFGTLRLFEDGHYSIGMSHGRWWKRGPTLEFDGPIAHWQATQLSGGELQFTFLRGPLEFSIVYGRAQEERRAER